MTTKSKRYTIAEIAALNEEAGGYFFSRDTLKFFRDKRSNWRVLHRAGRVFIRHTHPQGCMVPRTRNEDGFYNDQIREFFPDTGRISLPLKLDDVP